jgi:NAD(P)-dependent dehydrogenase (short-subunit alcohol dehydrogenase family)
MDTVLDTPVRTLQDHMTANVLAPATLVKAVLPRMVERGSGTIINVSSGAAWDDPPAAVGVGGWSYAYAMSKAALHRMSGCLKHELAGSGVFVHNVHPSELIVTERVALDMAEFGFDPSAGDPPAVVGAAIAWIAADPAGVGPNGSTFAAQEVCTRHDLLPGWRPAVSA